MDNLPVWLKLVLGTVALLAPFVLIFRILRTAKRSDAENYADSE